MVFVAVWAWTDVDIKRMQVRRLFATDHEMLRSLSHHLPISLALHRSRLRKCTRLNYTTP